MAEDTSQPTSVTTEPAKGKAKNKASKKKAAKKKSGAGKFGPLGFPKHPILKCLRMPQAVLENNAGKECTDREAAKFAGLGWTGPVTVEISSAIKYGLFERPSPGYVKPTDITRRILKPQKSTDKVDAIREALLKAPLIPMSTSTIVARTCRTTSRSWPTQQRRNSRFLQAESLN